MNKKQILMGAIPLITAAIASQAGATGRSLGAYFWTDGTVPNNTFVYDCARPAGHRAYLYAGADALDTCGHTATSNDNAVTGTTTWGPQFDDGTLSTCGKVVQHVASLESDLFDQNTGQITEEEYDPPGPPASGCWVSDTSKGKCISSTGRIAINTSVGISGTCAMHSYAATSLGQ